MFLKKIIKNNKGIDITLIGTAWIFILVVAVAAILDLYIITYSKETVIMITKSMQIYSLTSNFDHETAFYEQKFNPSNNTKQSIINTFQTQWNNRFGKINSNLSKTFIKDVSYNNYVYVTVNTADRSISLTTPNITFKPRKIIKSTTKVPFFGGKTVNYSNEVIHSGVSTKLKIF